MYGTQLYGTADLASRVWVANRCQQLNAQQIAEARRSAAEHDLDLIDALVNNMAPPAPTVCHPGFWIVTYCAPLKAYSEQAAPAVTADPLVHELTRAANGCGDLFPL